MNKEEQIAEKYLKALAIGSVKHEPDGRIPPDFSLDSEIAIEVRRLNENYLAGTKPEGLENISISLDRAFQDVLSSYDLQFDGSSYWVDIMYERPLPGGIKGTVRNIKRSLDTFLAGPQRAPIDLQANSKTWLTIHPSSPVAGRLFRPSIYTDDDSGGAVVELYVRNISHCIQDKVQKVSPYLHRYQEWWLLLIDSIAAWDLETYEIDQIKTKVKHIGCFQRLILLDYSGTRSLFQV